MGIFQKRNIGRLSFPVLTGFQKNLLNNIQSGNSQLLMLCYKYFLYDDGIAFYDKMKIEYRTADRTV